MVARLALAVTFVLVLCLVGAGSARAADFRSDTDLTIPATEQVNDDLYTAAETTTIAGHVTGDVLATGNKLTISGRVDGTVNALVGTAELSGFIGGNVRVGGGTVKISGPVSGDVEVAAGTLEIEPTGSVAGDIYLASGTLRVNGPVSGKIRGNASDITLNSTVGGAVHVVAKEIALGPNARLAQTLDYTSPDPVTMATGAVVAGQIKHTVSDRFYPGSDVVAWLFSPLFRLLSLLVAGLVLVLLFPAIAASVGDGIWRSPLAAIVAGILAIVLALVLIVVLAATVVGIPVALLGLGLYVAIWYLSQVFAGLAIGRLILPKRWDVAGRGYNLLAMAIGVVAIAAIRQIPVANLDAIVSAVCGVLAFGGVVAASHVRRRGYA